MTAPTDEMPERLSVGPTLLRIVLIPSLLLAAFTLALIWQVDRLREELEWVTHTDGVLNETDDVLIGVLNVQTSLRGYLITGNAEQLERHQDFRTRLVSAGDSLATRVADNSLQATAARAIRQQIDALAAYSDDLIGQRQRGIDVAVQLNRGESIVGRLRTELAAFEQREAALRLERRQTVQSAATSLIVSGFVFLIGGGLVFAFVVRRELGAITETYRRALNSATTDRRRMEEARDTAEAANRAKDQFLAMVSHELRNPLMPILTWTTLLRDEKLSDEQRTRGLESIDRSARSLTQLIDDLLDVSRIVSGKLRLDVRAIDLAPVINAALEAVKPAAEAKQVRLQIILDPRAGPIAGDSERLQQIVWNLLSNAIKFTPKGGRVHVALSRINSHLELAVSDTGQGIDIELLSHVFERFWQAEVGSTRQRSGLGLGLAIVRHLVELHGGSVEAHSDGLGHGAVFKVLLPLLVTTRSLNDDEEDSATSHDDVDGVRQQLAGIRVLVVDDDTSSLEAVAMLLSRSGAEVQTAGSTPQALDTLRQWHPDVLLSDIEMPGQDGYELIRTLRSWPIADGSDVPAVALTAYARVDDRVRVLGAGFQMHVVKPVDPAELLAVVVSLATRRA